MSPPTHSIQLALGADFLTAFSRLPHKQQKKVRQFLDEFTAAPKAPTHHYEKIQRAKDGQLRSVRIDQDYRGIVLAPERGNLHVLLWVDKHDEAYQWAIRRVCAVHPETGTMQVVLTDEAAAEAMAQAKLSGPSSEAGLAAREPVPASSPTAPALLARFTDDEIVSLGVPTGFLAHVRAVGSENELDRLEAILPREAFEGIFMLAAGYTVDEARSELGMARLSLVDTTDIDAAVRRDGSLRHFVVVSNAAEMEKLLAAPLEQWRVFLHPSQRRWVSMHAAGPVRILGSAGTGKTVVAMHRAAWLARTACQPGEKILFTTFTKNLAADIASQLRKLCSHEEWERIEVMNLDAWARRFLGKQGFHLRLTYEARTAGRMEEDLWKTALYRAQPHGAFPEDFFRSEWDNVVQAHGIETCEAYLAVSRVGRSTRLSRLQRQEIWPLFQEYRALLNERGLCEPADAYRAATRILRESHALLPYQAVVVDEAQDLGNEAFRLIRALVPEGPNDLFLVGDAHQRIYGHQVVLSRCGIDIRGRGRKLRINYRTTEELKNWATGLLNGWFFDDLDAGSDDAAEVRSLVHGKPPVVTSCATLGEASDAVLAYVLQLLGEEGARPETICVVAPTHRDLEEYRHRILPVCPAVHVIETGKPEDSAAPGLRMATIHRVKGLEFDHVILAERFEPVDPRATVEIPDAGADASLVGADRLRQRRSLLYVAATRARKSLHVCRLMD